MLFDVAIGPCFQRLGQLRRTRFDRLNPPAKKRDLDKQKRTQVVPFLTAISIASRNLPTNDMFDSATERFSITLVDLVGVQTAPIVVCIDVTDLHDSAGTCPNGSHRVLD